MNTWVIQDPRGSVVDKWLMWLLVASAAMLFSGVTIDRSTNAFFSDTRIVSQNNFITASVALNAAPFTAFNFERFVPGDVFVRPVQVTNSPVANNAGVVNVNYFMTIKDNFSNCSVATPQCVDAKGTLSDPVAGLRVVAVRCFSDELGTLNVDCAAAVSPGPSVKSVRLIKGVMETVWPGGASGPAADAAGVVRDWNPTVQLGNVGGVGKTNPSSDDAGRPIVFATAGALSGQPISVKVNPVKAVANGAVLTPAPSTIVISDNSGTPVSASVAVPAGKSPTEVASLLQIAAQLPAASGGLALPSMKVQASGMTLTFTWSESKLLKISGAPAMFGLPAPATATLASPFSGVPVTKASLTGAIATASNINTLTVSAVDSGTMFVGQTISGTGIAAGTKVSALGTGAGGTGTYILTSPAGDMGTVTSRSLSASAYPVQGSDVLRIGGTTIQDLDGNWAVSSVATCAALAPDATNGCGAEVIGVPIQTLSNPNCNGLATTDSVPTRAGRAVPGATGNAALADVSFTASLAAGTLTATGTQSGVKVGSVLTYSPTVNDPPRSVRVTVRTSDTVFTVVNSSDGSAPTNATLVTFSTGGATGPGANSAATAGAVPFTADSHGACFMGGPSFETAAPTTVFSPRINSQLMAAAAASNPRIVSDIPAQSLAGVGGLAAGATDNIALLAYLPSWSTQRTPDALVTGSVSGTTLTVTAVTSGSIKVGQTLYGLGVPDGLTIVSQATSTETPNTVMGKKGTYTVSTNTVTVASTKISAVTEATQTSLIVKTCDANSVINGVTAVVQVPCGGAGDNSVDADGKAFPMAASYTVAFTAVEPVGVTFTQNNAGAERSSLVPVGQARDVNGNVFAMNAPLMPDNAVLGSNGSGASLQARRRQGRGQGRLIA